MNSLFASLVTLVFLLQTVVYFWAWIESDQARHVKFQIIETMLPFFIIGVKYAERASSFQNRFYVNRSHLD